jgi:hypothetical protein
VIIGAKSPDQLRDNRSTRVQFDDAGEGGDVADARQSARRGEPNGAALLIRSAKDDHANISIR